MSVDLEDFKQSYQRMCKEFHTEPDDHLLQQILLANQKPHKSGGYSLNLSTLSLSNKTCAILGKLFTCNCIFTEVKFNDCSLSDDAVRAICYGLTENVGCRRLDLKGNSIRGTGSEAVGRMIRQNSKLNSLCLEWNAMGLIESAFAVFCEGLGGNTALHTLDLRSNQISHHGAVELASSLKRNSTLRCLDLRWNNIGLLGGRALLACFDYNKTLVKLLLAGNNIPGDVLKAIDIAIAHNSDRTELTINHQQRQHVLCNEIREIKKMQNNEMVQLLDKVDRQDISMQLSRRSATERICKLQDTLEERKQQFNNITTKLSLTESELALSESRTNELNQQLLLTKEELVESTKQHQNDVKHEREERAILETRLNKEVTEANERNYQLENKIDDLERKCRTQQENIFELKENLAHHQAELKMKHAQFEEMLQFEKHKTKEYFRDVESNKTKEIERIKKEQDDSERNLKDRILRVESQRLELEEELSRLKASMISDRMQMDDQITSAKQRIRNEEDQRRIMLEEKIRVLQSSRDELQTHNIQQTSLVADLQSKNSQLSIENETLKRRIVDLQQDLNGKNADMLEEVTKVKLDLNRKIERLENDRKSKEDLYNQISTLEKNLSDMTMKYQTTSETKDLEIQNLKETLRQMKEADLQRSNMLQTAVQSYVTRSPYNA